MDRLLGQLESDLEAAGVSSKDYHFVANTVAISGEQINTILKDLGAGPLGATYDAVNSEFFDQDIIVEETPPLDYGNLHDYDHVEVGKANVQLLLDTFVQVQNFGKILCVGDSITEATVNAPINNGNLSWRYPFWKHLVDNNVAHEFVGTRTENQGAARSTQLTVVNPLSIATKRSGTTALERGSNATSFLATLKAQDETPDTAVVFLGGNDISSDNTDSALTVRDRIKVIIDKLQGDVEDSGNPNIRILLVSILPRFSAGSPDSDNTRFQEINALLATLAVDENDGQFQCDVSGYL